MVCECTVNFGASEITMSLTIELNAERIGGDFSKLSQNVFINGLQKK